MAAKTEPITTKGRPKTTMRITGTNHFQLRENQLLRGAVGVAPREAPAGYPIGFGCVLIPAPFSYQRLERPLGAWRANDAVKYASSSELKGRRLRDRSGGSHSWPAC